MCLTANRVNHARSSQDLPTPATASAGYTRLEYPEDFPGSSCMCAGPGTGVSLCADTKSVAGVDVASATSPRSLAVVDSRDAGGGLRQSSLCLLAQAPVG